MEDEEEVTGRREEERTSGWRKSREQLLYGGGFWGKS